MVSNLSTQTGQNKLKPIKYASVIKTMLLSPKFFSGRLQRPHNSAPSGRFISENSRANVASIQIRNGKTSCWVAAQGEKRRVREGYRMEGTAEKYKCNSVECEKLFYYDDKTCETWILRSPGLRPFGWVEFPSSEEAIRTEPSGRCVPRLLDFEFAFMSLVSLKKSFQQSWRILRELFCYLFVGGHHLLLSKQSGQPQNGGVKQKHHWNKIPQFIVE